MIGITLTSEQIRAAPPEVRRWIERQVMASFSQQQIQAPEEARRADWPGGSREWASDDRLSRKQSTMTHHGSRLSQKLPCLTDGVQSSGVQHCHRNSVQLSALNSDGLNVQTGSVRLGAPSGCLFGASAKSIARLAAVTASSRLTACPERFPAVSNRTDHFQSPGLIPCRIRYSTPRCSMQPTPEDD
jgi:hypothetical protein